VGNQDHLSVYVYLKDLQGKYIYANEMLCQMWKTSLDKVIGNDDGTFFDSETAAQIKKVDQQTLSQGKKVCAEENVTLSGQNLTSIYKSTKLPLRNTKGEVYALLGVSTDITELVNAKKAADNANLAKSEMIANPFQGLFN